MTASRAEEVDGRILTLSAASERSASNRLFNYERIYHGMCPDRWNDRDARENERESVCSAAKMINY